jgi:hypothetical protein
MDTPGGRKGKTQSIEEGVDGIVWAVGEVV